MSEKQPFYKKPLNFLITSRGLKQKLSLDFNESDILHPNVLLDGRPIIGELVLCPMYRHGNVQTTNVKLLIKNDGSFIGKRRRNLNNGRFTATPIEFNLFEFTPFIVGLLKLGRLGIIPIGKLTDFNQVKDDGYTPKISNGNLETLPISKEDQAENASVSTAKRKKVFRFKINKNGQLRTHIDRMLIIDTESTYNKVTVERNNSYLKYFIQAMWLTSKIKRYAPGKVT